MKYPVVSSENAQEVRLHIKGCGVDVSLIVNNDMPLAKLAEHLQHFYKIPMQNIYFNVEGTRLSVKEIHALQDCFQPGNREECHSIFIESGPLSE